MTAELTRIAEVLNGAKSCEEAGSALRSLGLTSKLATAVVQALDYDPTEPEEVERRKQYGVFAPMIEYNQGVWPPPLQEVEDDTRECWSRVLEQPLAPAIKARMADLLWVGRFGPEPFKRAQSAVDSYVEFSAGRPAGSLSGAQALMRSSEIAYELNDDRRVATTTAAIVAAASSALSLGAQKPGVLMRLIRRLCSLPRPRQPEELNNLLERATQVYLDDPAVHDGLCALRLARLGSDDPQRREIEGRRIQVWVESALKTQGLQRVSLFQEAVNRAVAMNRNDLADEVRVHFQEASRDLELSEISAVVEVPRAQIEAYLESFMRPNELTGTLERFGAHVPGATSAEGDEAFVEDLMRTTPLQFLVTKVVLGPRNMPLKYVSTWEEHRQTALEEQRRSRVSLWASFAAEILARAFTQYRPSREELVGYFRGASTTADDCEAIGEAIVLFQEGRYEASLMTSLPSLESAVRSMSHQVGLALYWDPSGERAGRAKGLGHLLDQLEGRFPEEARQYLRITLVDPFGLNLRNHALHGLLARVTKEHAALAIHCIAMLALVRVKTGESSDAGDPGERL